MDKWNIACLCLAVIVILCVVGLLVYYQERKIHCFELTKVEPGIERFLLCK